MKVIDAIKKTLVLWNKEKYEDYINGKSDPNMNLLFEIREDIYKDRFSNKSEKIIGLFRADKDFVREDGSSDDGSKYIIDEQQIVQIKLFKSKEWKPCNIRISDGLKTRIQQRNYNYTNEFDHWISYLIVKYLNDCESNVGSNFEDGIKEIKDIII